MKHSKGWDPRLGAIPEAGGTRFGVWAPAAQSIELVLENGGIHELQRDPDSLWCGFFPDVQPGDLYRYRIDERDNFPDPATRFQPQGVHGPSQVVDPRTFEWTDRDWPGIRMQDAVVYELHAGSFSQEGTFDGARKRLPYLADLGVTAVELMPIADFPGMRNWGYDGACLFAPARCYGTPDDLRRFVNDAHERGIAVLLDVVYNHFGPDGAYTVCYSPYYFTNRHKTPWGDGINFDGEHSRWVRGHFFENALHWIHEYHMDGLRLDATHAMMDDSSTHFVTELTAAVHASVSGRKVLVIAEDHRNLAEMVRPVETGGWGMDGVWADDFHHEIRRYLAGDSDGYFRDFRGGIQDLATILRKGWLFCGEYSEYFREKRGTDPAGIPAERFIFFLQNHDQVGNRALGERLHHQIDAASFRAATTLMLLAPQTPLLFMGQEWGASTPFLYFTDHNEELGRLVREGRRKEFSRFATFSTPEAQLRIPDAQAPSTFEDGRLQWSELELEPHASLLRLHRTLLRLRRTEPALQHGEAASHNVEIAGDDALILTRRNAVSEIRIVIFMKGAGEVRTSTTGDLLLTTEAPEFAPEPAPPQIDGGIIRFHRPGALVLRSVLQP